MDKRTQLQERLLDEEDKMAEEKQEKLERREEKKRDVVRRQEEAIGEMKQDIKEIQEKVRKVGMGMVLTNKLAYLDEGKQEEFVESIPPEHHFEGTQEFYDFLEEEYQRNYGDELNESDDNQFGFFDSDSTYIYEKLVHSID